MTSGSKFAICGYTAGIVLAGAPTVYGFAVNGRRKSIDSDDFLQTCGNEFRTAGGDTVLLSGMSLDFSCFDFRKDGDAFEGADSDAFGFLKERFGEYGAREVFSVSAENYFTASDAKVLKKLGVTCIRLSLDSKTVFRNGNPEKEDPILERTDSVIKACGKAGIYVILSFSDKFADVNASGRKGFKCRNSIIKMWSKMAVHYRDNPVVAAYDISTDADSCIGTEEITADVMTKFYARAVKALRTLEDNHIVIVDGDYLPDQSDENTIAGYSANARTEYETIALIRKATKVRDSGKAAILTRLDNFAGAADASDACVSFMMCGFKGKDDRCLYRCEPEIDISVDGFDEINEKSSNSLITKNCIQNKEMTEEFKKVFAFGGKPERKSKSKIYYGSGSAFRFGG